ncbi:MAG: peroxiredoxin-like family protein [Phycisphaerales bacterium]
MSTQSSSGAEPASIPVWIRRWLFAAGVYNIVWGVAVVAFPMLLFRLLGLEEPVYPQIWQCVGMIVGVYGVGYLIASRDPARHWPIVLVGLLGKIFGPIGFVYSVVTGSFPWVFAVTIVTNDLIWYPAFVASLVFAWKSSMGTNQSERGVLGVREALDRFEASSGKRLLAESASSGLLVVFLRHAGCTFCREALGDLRSERGKITESGARIVLVHMSRDDSIERLAERYGLGDVLFVRDPDRALYRAFELRRGSLGQLFGWRVIRRWIAATFRGHGIGGLRGDGFQMPGAFLVRDGIIVRAFRHETAADRPDYCELASA